MIEYWKGIPLPKAGGVGQKDFYQVWSCVGKKKMSNLQVFTFNETHSVENKLFWTQIITVAVKIK